MSKLLGRFGRRHAAFLLILLLAAALRWINIGAEKLSTDESAISLKAIALARHGHFELLGTPMSVGMWHSPLSIYLYSIPFLVSADPRLARAFTGLLAVGAVGVVYWIGEKYFNPRAGLVAALLYAIHPEALVTARKIWNPDLGALFVMLYMVTGLLGYFDDKRWARLAHLPMLSLAGQCHPSTFMLAPITLILWSTAWHHRPHKRRQFVSHAVASSMLFLLLLVPWGIGLYQYAQHPGSQTGVIMGSNRGFPYLYSTLFILLGNWEKSFTQPIQPILTIVGSAWLIARVVSWRDGVPGLVAVLGFFLVPSISFLLDIPYRDYHIWPSYGNAFLIQGAVIGGVIATSPASAGRPRFWNWCGLMNDRYLKWISLPVLAVLVTTQLHFFFRYDRTAGKVTLDEHIAAIEDAADGAVRTGKALLLLVPYGDDNWYAYLPWEVLNEGIGARVVWQGRGMPLPVRGAVLLGPEGYAGRSFVFSGGEIIQRGFRLAELPPAEHFNPNLIPLEPIHFSNGATVLGFLRETPDSLPQARQPWTIFMIWRVDTLGTEDYKIFTHLVDATGEKHAQADEPGLPVGQQRVGEYVMNQLDFEVSENLTKDGPLYLHFGMYNDAHRAEVLDSSGDSLGTLGVIQIPTEIEPLAKWASIELTDLVFEDQIRQGPPLEIAATWHILHTPEDDLNLRWRLLPEDRGVAFEESTDLVSDLPPTALPSGVLTTEQYLLRIPTDIAAGNYRLEVQLVDSLGQFIGEPYHTPIEVITRARRFEPPIIEHALHSQFGDQFELLGYDLEQNGRSLAIALHWQALTPIGTDYKYFIHVWGDGQVVAQMDAMPDSCRYPTSWWAQGEIFSDLVSLDLSTLDAGTYTVTIGLYDPRTNERPAVTLQDGSVSPEDWVVLQDIGVSK